jgi:hypothetical protein
MQKMETELQKGKKGGKKPKWGPVIPLRRSSRNVDNGKLMMGKAQEAKRKWNLDDRTGIPTKKTLKFLNLFYSLLPRILA